MSMDSPGSLPVTWFWPRWLRQFVIKAQNLAAEFVASMCYIKSNIFFPKVLQNQVSDKNTCEAAIDLPATLCVKRTFFSTYFT